MEPQVPQVALVLQEPLDAPDALVPQEPLGAPEHLENQALEVQLVALDNQESREALVLQVPEELLDNLVLREVLVAKVPLVNLVSASVFARNCLSACQRTTHGLDGTMTSRRPNLIGTATAVTTRSGGKMTDTTNDTKGSFEFHSF